MTLNKRLNAFDTPTLQRKADNFLLAGLATQSAEETERYYRLMIDAETILNVRRLEQQPMHWNHGGYWEV